MKSESDQTTKWVGLALWCAAFSLFMPAARFQFVNYDDFAIIFNRAQVFSGISLRNLVWAFSSLHADFAYWMPLTWISHQMDCQLFGTNAGFHHLTNVLLHSVNTLLLFHVLRRMTGSLWRSAAVALLFAWHPLHVETVAWVAERKSLVCSFFWMLALLAYIRYVRTKTWPNYLMVCAGHLGALMGKPMAVTLPFTLMLLDFWPLNRLRDAGGDTKRDWRDWAPMVVEKLPLFALSIVGGFMAYLGQMEIGALPANIGCKFRFANALVAYWLYLRKTFWPNDLIPLYGRHPWPNETVVLAAILLATISVLAVLLKNKRPYLIVGWCWYLGNLFPSIGLVPFGVQAMADRYTYIPLIGIFIMLAWGMPEVVAKFGFRFRWFRCALWGASAVVLLVLALCTLRQLAYWRDGVTLFMRETEVAPLNPMAHCYLAGNLITVNEYGPALAQAEEALRLEPDSAESLQMLGFILRDSGRFVESRSCYRKALIKNPNHKKALYGLANLLCTLDVPIRDGVAAIPLAKRLCELTGDRYPKNLSLLACAYASAGRFPEAVETAKKALLIAEQTEDYQFVSKLTEQLYLFNEGKSVCKNPGVVGINDSRAEMKEGYPLDPN
jgi:tetratricopeptide (TPR) repeat protein